MFPLPKSTIWRTLSAIVVVIGGLQVLFTSWSLMHVSKAVVAEQFEEVCLDFIKKIRADILKTLINGIE